MSAQESTALSEESRIDQSPTDAFIAPLRAIGAFDAHTLPAQESRRRASYGRHARSVRHAAWWRWPKWLRGPGASSTDERPASVTTMPFDVSRRVRDLLSALANISHGHPNAEVDRLVNEIRRLPQPDDKLAEDFDGYITHEPSPDGRFHRLTLRKLPFTTGEGKLDALDISGIDANVALRLENCAIDVLDVSHARLHSLDLKGCRPSMDSPLANWGMRIFARELQVTDSLMIGQGARPTEIVMLDASSATAREIQILEGTRFKGGQLARKIWDRLLERLEALPHDDARAKGGSNHADPLAGLDAGSLIRLHTVAARDVLRTLALYSVKADKIIISVEACGIIDLHDAEVRTQVLIDADFDNRIENLDPLATSLSKRAKSCLSSEDQKLLSKSALYLSGRLSPCLDLAGLRCDGEIRFDGPEPPEDNDEQAARLKDAPPVRGHINLTNARCSVFTDDGTWLYYATKGTSNDARTRKLTFGLSSFHYEYFGQSPRLLSDTDPEFKRHRWFERPRDPRRDLDAVVEDAIDRQRRRMITLEASASTANEVRSDSQLAYVRNSSQSPPKRSRRLNPFEVSSLKVVGIDKDLVRKKLDWLKAARPLDDDDDVPEEYKEQFDAQPWTHCAAVLRKAGWRIDVNNILYQRDHEAHRPRLVPLWQTAVFGAVVFAIFLLGAVAYQVTTHQPVPLLFLQPYLEHGPLFKAAIVTCVVAVIFALPPVFAWIHQKWRSRDDRQERPYSFPESLWYRLLGTTFGYGFRSERALFYSVSLIVVGAGIFLFAHTTNLLIINPSADESASQGPIRPGLKDFHESALGAPRITRDQRILHYSASAQYKRVSERNYQDCPGYDDALCNGERIHPIAPGESNAPAVAAKPIAPSTAPSEQRKTEAENRYPTFNPLMYSVDVFIPLIDFSQGSYWVPSFNGGDLFFSGTRQPEWCDHFLLFFVWIYYWFLVAAGWWFTSIFVVSLAGVLDRKE